jgi:hypothetical protein
MPALLPLCGIEDPRLIGDLFFLTDPNPHCIEDQTGHASV